MKKPPSIAHSPSAPSTPSCTEEKTMSTALAPAMPLPRVASPAVSAPASELLVSSRSLLGGASTLVIEHQGMHYTLRATRNGKLILTK